MSAAMRGEERVRTEAGRALAYALLASILLHALLLAALPSLRESSAPEPAAPEPLTVRVVRIEPPAPAVPPVARQTPEAPPPRPRPPAAKPAPPPEPKAEIAATAPPPAPEAVPAAPASLATPVAAPAPIALARIDVRELASSAPKADSGALERYRTDINIAAARFKLYPRAAVDNNWEGEVVVMMAIGADGRIDALRVKASSGYDLLDRQALDMFRTAKSYVRIPAELRGKPFELELRAIYGLRDQASG
jgi:protein TonB